MHTMTTTSTATLAIPTEDSVRVLPATARILPGVGLATPYVTVGDAARRRLIVEGWTHVSTGTSHGTDYDHFVR